MLAHTYFTENFAVPVVRTQIFTRDLTKPYTAPGNAVVSHGARFVGLEVFADHTKKQKNKRKQCVHETLFCAVQHFTCVFLHAHAGIKMVQDLGSHSGVYLQGYMKTSREGFT